MDLQNYVGSYGPTQLYKFFVDLLSYVNFTASEDFYGPAQCTTMLVLVDHHEGVF